MHTNTEEANRILSKLKCLHMEIITACRDMREYMSDGSKPYQFVNIFQFMEDLPTRWLIPASSTLTHLHLAQDEMFGYYPKLELCSVHFPKLDTLVLGHYTFHSDWQLSWLQSHGGTLRTLTLGNCPIIAAFRLNADDLDDECYIKTAASCGASFGSPYLHSYDRRWDSVFSRFRTDLPRLEIFRFGQDCRFVTEFGNEYDDVGG